MRRLLAAMLAVVGCTPAPDTQGVDPASLSTRAERTDYRETTSYAEVIDFLETIEPLGDLFHRTAFGYTVEGRRLPLMVVGDVADASPVAVGAADKLKVWIQGNIHGGEVCGKEALLMLLRALASGQHAAWMDTMVLLIAPIYNADGNERVRLDNRAGQHGPVGGMGQRRNAQGYDLNRDHTKLESPEARSLVAALDAYDPDVVVDLHTTNGTEHAYHLTYAPPLHPSTHSSIDRLLRGEWLPAITAEIKTTRGWDVYYYGNVAPREGPDRGWRTFDHRPRFNNNYAGLRNRFGILSEAYAYATFEERVLASLWFVEALLDYAHAHASAIRAVAAQADAESIVGQRLALRAAPRRSERPVEILLGDTVREVNPYSGRAMLRRTDTRRPEPMYEYGSFEPTVIERVPATYYVPAGLVEVIDRLAAHGVTLDRLDRDRAAAVERFVITGSRVDDEVFEGHNERVVVGRWEPSEASVPAGTVVVRLDQPLGRLAFALLEPRSDDGLVNWNVLDAALDGASVYPILRTAP